MKRFQKFTIALASALLLVGSAPVKADEGMWLLMYLNKNYEQMKKLGLKLTPEDIYSINNSSVKDAIVSLRFCSAELVSADGLMLTNHHCGYETIQYYSSVENDYLTNGFYAKTKADELPADGVDASILIRMDDVTARLKPYADDPMAYMEEENKIIAEATSENYYRAEINEMFDGNQYFLFVYETFPDVRLVGAPPSAIGKFGGDTDNWEWPRQTGDFSIMRVYTAPDGSPAPYSEENVPYHPRHFLPISLKGVETGDFAMIMGFPGRTDRYRSSYGINLDQSQSNPVRVKIRGERLSLIKEDMDRDESIRIKYAAKYSQVSNYYKYFIGQDEGLARLHTVKVKQGIEKDFIEWVNADQSRKDKYGDALNQLENAYTQYQPYDLFFQYMVEAYFGVEIEAFALQFRGLNKALSADSVDIKQVNEIADQMKPKVEDYFKDYNLATDQKVFAALIAMMYNDLPADQRPEFMVALNKKYKGNWTKLAAKVYAKSFLASKEAAMAFLDNPTLKTMQKDLGFSMMTDMLNHYFTIILPNFRTLRAQIAEGRKTYLAGLMEMHSDRFFYPDANSTERLTYGTVRDYYPRDGVKYLHFTTLDGIMEKEDPNNEEFIVPAKLKQLYLKKDFGPYADKDGSIHTDFLTDNDITGGNSGSSVINGNGELIGIAFDGNWEAMTGDLIYDDEYKRTISVDIRYVLFVIDKVMGAKNLINEMTLVE